MAARTPSSIVRTSLIVSSVAGIVLGLIALFLPDATLITIATLFGIALVVAGLVRLIWALADRGLGSTARVLLGLFGLLVLIAGVIALVHPFATLLVVAVLIGISWILNGIRDVIFGVRDVTGGTRVLAVTAGVVSILGGIVVLTLPNLALQTFTMVAGVLLIVVSVATLLTLPARRRART